jgi:hypothetical protein
MKSTSEALDVIQIGLLYYNDTEWKSVVIGRFSNRSV